MKEDTGKLLLRERLTINSTNLYQDDMAALRKSLLETWPEDAGTERFLTELRTYYINKGATTQNL